MKAAVFTCRLPLRFAYTCQKTKNCRPAVLPSELVPELPLIVKTHSSKTGLIVRIATLLALVVSGFGQTFHRHQECTGRCDIPVNVSAAQPVAHHCCDHSHSAVPDSQQHPGRGEGNPTPAHDEHQCAICSVLAQTPQAPVVVELPQYTGPVWLTIDNRPVAAKSRVPSIVNPRGPPTAGLCPVA